MNCKLFIIYTADDCGACVTFKKTHLIKLLSLLEDNKSRCIKIRQINVSSIGDRSPINNVHPQLIAANKWFPGFYLFDEKEFYDFDSNLSGYVMGGQFVNGVQKMIKDKEYSYDANHVLNWVLYLTKSKLVNQANEEIGFLNPEKLFT